MMSFYVNYQNPSVYCFLVQIRAIIFKPQQDWQIWLNIALCFQAMCDKYRLPFVEKFHEEPLAQHYEVLVHVWVTCFIFWQQFNKKNIRSNFGMTGIQTQVWMKAESWCNIQSCRACVNLNVQEERSAITFWAVTIQNNSNFIKRMI